MVLQSLNLPSSNPAVFGLIKAEQYSGKIASDIKVHINQRWVIEFLYAENIAAIDWNQVVDVSTVKQWAMYSNKGDSNVHDKLCSKCSIYAKLLRCFSHGQYYIALYSVGNSSGHFAGFFF